MFKSSKEVERGKMEVDKIVLVDIGNTYAKIYHDREIKVVQAKEFYHDEKFYYISVNHDVSRRLSKDKNAINLEPFIMINSDYKGLGIDRKVLCSFIDDGVIVDAGSAITVDVMIDGVHKGGYILPGIEAYFRAYHDISDALKVDRTKVIMMDKIPQNTSEAINYAVVKSIVSFVKEIAKDKKIYFCGGDGEFLSSFFKGSIYKKDLIFDAMKKIIKENIC